MLHTQPLLHRSILAVLRQGRVVTQATHQKYGMSTKTDSTQPLLSNHLVELVTDKSLLKTECLVGGDWARAGDGATFEVDNPATGDVIARVARMGANETRAAIAKAAASFPQWAARTGKERAAVLHAWYDAIVDAADDITTIMTLESGKPKAEAKAEFAAGILLVLLSI